MKSKQSIVLILLVSAILSSLNLSCNSAKTAVSCPDISIKKSNFRGHRIINRNALHARKTEVRHKNISRSKQSRKQENQPATPNIVFTGNNQISKIEFNNALVASSENSFHPLIVSSNTSIINNEASKPNTKNNTINFQETKCDTIILKSGVIIIGKVEEIGQTEVKYRKCVNLTGPIISVLKSEVSRILYSNGTSDLFGPSDINIQNQFYNPNPNIPGNYPAPKTEGLGLAGFISAIVGLFIASIPLGIVAVIFGSISLSKIKRNPQRYKGRGFALAAIIVGLIDVIGMIIILGSI